MAIKLPDPGNGIPEQKTGNDEWTNMKIVRDNFADRSNAASRLVGDDINDISANGSLSKNTFARISTNEINKTDLNNSEYGIQVHSSAVNSFGTATCNVWTIKGYNASAIQFQLPYTQGQHGAYAMRYKDHQGTWQSWAQIYTSGNTTVDSNKNIKTSSPVVRVFADHLDKIHEANDLPIKYTRNGVGDYTIEGTTGLRENDWQIVIPKDDHDNQLIAFTIEDDNGTIRLKTYKRIFSMETFTFGPDLKTPLDIPEGRWVDLHFNDIPQEQLDEPTI